MGQTIQTLDVLALYNLFFGSTHAAVPKKGGWNGHYFQKQNKMVLRDELKIKNP